MKEVICLLPLGYDRARCQCSDCRSSHAEKKPDKQERMYEQRVKYFRPGEFDDVVRDRVREIEKSVHARDDIQAAIKQVEIMANRQAEVEAKRLLLSGGLECSEDNFNAIWDAAQDAAEKISWRISWKRFGIVWYAAADAFSATFDLYEKVREMAEENAEEQRKMVTGAGKYKEPLKRRLYQQQGGICEGCLRAFLIGEMQIDHIVARSKGGADHISNFQLLCAPCNISKGNKDYFEWMNRESPTWVKTMLEGNVGKPLDKVIAD